MSFKGACFLALLYFQGKLCITLLHSEYVTCTVESFSEPEGLVLVVEDLTNIQDRIKMYLNELLYSVRFNKIPESYWTLK